jgi:hypothetical protein
VSLKRRAWLTLGAVVLGGGGVATYALAGTADDPGATGRDKRPVRVYDLTLKGTGSRERELPRTSTEQFSMLGVSWSEEKKRLKGTAQVRTRSIDSGKWSGWQDLDLEEGLSEVVEPGMRGAAEPIWVGPSDGVEVQVVAADGTASAALPKGLQVNLVDPGVVTSAETKSIDTEFEPAAFVAETGPAATPTGAVTPTDTVTPTDAPTEPAPDPSTTDPTATDATATPTDTGSGAPPP